MKRVVDATEVCIEQGHLALTEDEAMRFLDALNEVDDESVVRLRDLRGRQRATPPQ